MGIAPESSVRTGLMNAPEQVLATTLMSISSTAGIGSTTTQSLHDHNDDPDPHVILIVDDERPIVDFLHDLLESEGYRVQDAFDGAEAIRILRRTNPQLVISDVEMPRVGGHDLLRFIDQIPHDSVPKVIFMSASGQQAADPRLPFLEKPFDIDDLLDLIDSALGDDTPQ